MTDVRRIAGASVLLALAALGACRSRRTPPAPPRPRSDAISVFLQSGTTQLQPYLDGYPLGDLGSRLDLLANTNVRSMHFLQANRPIGRHLRRERTETCHVLRGEGVVYIADRSYPVSPGATFRIPAGTVHSLLPSEGSTVVAIVYLEPPLLERDDRVPVQ